MCRSFLTSSGRWELLDCIHVGVCHCTFLTSQPDTSDCFCGVFFYIFFFFSLFDELTSSDFSQTGVMNLLIWTKSERLNLNASDLWLDSDLNLLSWNDLLTSSPSVHRFVVFLTTNTLWISPMPANRMEWSEANSMQKKNTWDHLEPKLGSCPCLELESGPHRLRSPKLSKEAKRQYAFFIPLSFLQTFFIAWPVW